MDRVCEETFAVEMLLMSPPQLNPTARLNFQHSMRIDTLSWRARWAKALLSGGRHSKETLLLEPCKGGSPFPGSPGRKHSLLKVGSACSTSRAME